MALEVIGAGLGRTGTHSLATALEKLGFGPCYTLYELDKNLHHLDRWIDALDGKTVDWTALFEAYRSTVEWPGVGFVDQLIEAFPDAKVILTIRDAESWYQSASSTIFEGLELSQHNPNPRTRKSGAFKRRLILQTMLEGKYHDKAHAIKLFNRHNDDVRRLVSAERLLVFNVKQGWQPLCAFLNKPIPDFPFPRVNERENHLATMPEWARQIRQEHAKNRSHTPGSTDESSE